MSSVSVVIPCYNYAHYLRDCVDSVLAQDGVDVRVLVIDDESSDDTPAVAASIVARDPRVEYRRHANNRGHIATYNEGLEWADAEYVVLLSADDLLTPGALRRATRLMDAHPAVGFVYGRHVRFSDEHARPEPRLPSGDGAWRVQPGLDWLEALCRRGVNTIASPEVVVRTAVQHMVGGYRSDLPHTGDMEMWMRLAVHSPVGEILDADQAFYRVHGQSMHAQHFPPLKDVQQRRAAFAAIFEQHGDLTPASFRVLADQALARESLRAASLAYDYGQVESMPIEQVIAAHRDAGRERWHDRTYVRRYVALRVRMLLGPRMCPRVRAFRENVGLLDRGV
jgi:glycosyltransferase involved in cell wall biosynthesis